MSTKQINDLVTVLVGSGCVSSTRRDDAQKIIEQAVDLASVVNGKLTEKLEYMLLLAVKQQGECHRRALSYIEEDLNAEDYQLLSGFVDWLGDNNLKIGWGNVQMRFAAYQAHK